MAEVQETLKTAEGFLVGSNGARRSDVSRYIYSTIYNLYNDNNDIYIWYIYIYIWYIYIYIIIYIYIYIHILVCPEVSRHCIWIYLDASGLFEQRQPESLRLSGSLDASRRGVGLCADAKWRGDRGLSEADPLLRPVFAAEHCSIRGHLRLLRLRGRASFKTL